MLCEALSVLLRGKPGVLIEQPEKRFGVFVPHLERDLVYGIQGFLKHSPTHDVKSFLTCSKSKKTLFIFFAKE